MSASWSGKEIFDIFSWLFWGGFRGLGFFMYQIKLWAKLLRVGREGERQQHFNAVLYLTCPHGKRSFFKLKKSGPKETCFPSYFYRNTFLKPVKCVSSIGAAEPVLKSAGRQDGVYKCCTRGGITGTAEVLSILVAGSTCETWLLVGVASVSAGRSWSWMQLHPHRSVSISRVYSGSARLILWHPRPSLIKQHILVLVRSR